jgi:glc operon protein GlcG
MNRLITTTLWMLVLTLTRVDAFAADFVSRPTLTSDGAKSVAATAIRYAHDHAAPGAAIAIVDSGGVLLYAERIDGTFQNAANISIGKARTAVLFGKPTRVFEDIVNKGRYAMLAVPEVASFTPLMGGVPIEIGGQVAGAIGVSGAASAAQDDEIASAAAADFARQHAPGVAATVVVPRATVDAGFASDAHLVSGEGFRVDASHRSGPGEAEVHVRDTDIFYVQKGSADLVVGGQVSGEHPIADGELRGAAIEGGDLRHIAAGDVVVIPRGVPHWFKKVSTPFTYYVVKSTSP